jgi:hypothetical protein
MGKLKSVEEMFEGRHFSAEVIILCVRLANGSSVLSAKMVLIKRRLSAAEDTTLTIASSPHLESPAT